MRNISPVVKDDDIEKKKHTHSVENISNFPDIPDKNTVIDWGFYVKATSGIPKTDLAADVQASLGKADTALQSYTEKYTGTYSKPTDGIPKSDLASAVQASLGKADTHESSKRNYRTAVVGQSSGATTNPYYKFASISMSSGEDAAISFKVSRNHYDQSTCMGIITAHVRTDANGYWHNGELVWEYALSGINPADFMLVHNTSVKPAITELWIKVATQWVSYHFDVISEGTRTTSNNELWTLYNKVSAGSEAALPTDMVSQASTLGTLKNSILGDAKTVNKHTVNSDVPANAKFTDTVYAHPTTSGNKHIPSGGSAGQILRWSADGTAVWGDEISDTDYQMQCGTVTVVQSTSSVGLDITFPKKFKSVPLIFLSGSPPSASTGRKYPIIATFSELTAEGFKLTSWVTSSSGLTALSQNITGKVNWAAFGEIEEDENG